MISQGNTAFPSTSQGNTLLPFYYHEQIHSFPSTITRKYPAREEVCLAWPTRGSWFHSHARHALKTRRCFEKTKKRRGGSVTRPTRLCLARPTETRREAARPAPPRPAAKCLPPPGAAQRACAAIPRVAVL